MNLATIQICHWRASPAVSAAHLLPAAHLTQPTIFVIDHDVALFDTPLRDVIDALGNV